MALKNISGNKFNKNSVKSLYQKLQKNVENMT